MLGFAFAAAEALLAAASPAAAAAEAAVVPSPIADPASAVPDPDDSSELFLLNSKNFDWKSFMLPEMNTSKDKTVNNYYL